VDEIYQLRTQIQKESLRFKRADEILYNLQPCTVVGGVMF